MTKTWLIIALLSGAGALALALLYVANEKAKLHAAKEAQPLWVARLRVRRANQRFILEHGREPTIPELIDILYPVTRCDVCLREAKHTQPVDTCGVSEQWCMRCLSTELGEGAQSYGLPPSHALREMGFTGGEIVDLRTGEVIA